MRVWIAELRGALASQRVIINWLFVSFLLAVAGPFGTYETMSTGLRMIYWPGLSAISVVLGFGIILATEAWLPNRRRLLVALLQVALYTLIFTPILRMITLALVPDEPLRDRPPQVLYIIVALVAAAVLVLRWAFDKIDRARRAPDRTITRPRLYNRLPAESRGEIVRLTVNDHYVEVHLSDGEVQRLLMRFSDAISEMDLVPGHSTHRSHWVSDRYVVGSAREKGREFLTLSNGERVPVGRKYRADLVRAGLLGAALTDGNGQTPPPGQNGPNTAAEEHP